MNAYPPGAVAIVSRGDVADTILDFYAKAILPSGTAILPPYRSGPYVYRARNEAVGDMLRHPTHLEWICFIDSDEECRDPRAIIRLLEHNQAIVSGIVVERAVPFHLPAYTSVAPVRRLHLRDLPWKGLVRVEAVGAGFLLIRRAVFEALGAPWFRAVGELEDGTVMGEDLDFTYRASQKGFGVFIDPGLPLGHHVRATVWPRVGHSNPWLSVSGTAEQWFPLKEAE